VNFPVIQVSLAIFFGTAFRQESPLGALIRSDALMQLIAFAGSFFVVEKKRGQKIKESIWNTLDIHLWRTGRTTGDTSCPIRNGVPDCLSAQVMQINH